MHRLLMFSRRGLFGSIPCPERTTCTRNPCLFSHQQGLADPSAVRVPAATPPKSILVAATPPKSILKSTPAASSDVSVPAKRALAASPATPAARQQPTPTSEPPRKIQRLAYKSAQPAASSQPTGEPALRVNPAASRVPVLVRQTCLKSLYAAFLTLYDAFHAAHPHLAGAHALAQETEIYDRTNKQTYRQGVVTTIVALKKRAVPPSPQHESVGTEAECRARANARKVARVEARDLECAVLTREQMVAWGYVVDVPAGPGGDRPSAEGDEMVCERCFQRFVVTPPGQGKDEACSFHWARPYTTTLNGEKIKTYKCCGMSHPGPGCAVGPHVFYEKTAEELHRRHPFSLSSHPPSALAEDAVLDVAALDCEMIYTTGGMRVARVSVVDGDGEKVFDEFVRMDDGVKVIDYITRFSGVTPERLAAAVLDLAATRRALRAFIGPHTVLVGHALDNDLKTLRMVHHRVVDTCVLFPHRGGPPYRRALRDLVSDKLQRMIQTGDEAAGHSSVEDAAATLDLVRWWITNERTARSSASRSTGGGSK
ncbi:ribonuclease H-like protein [Gautieria morchelliformis]|nr:ribonuclease H-like protein [Gautieria morchelliformis]